ncbi:MAG: hypothetical protein HF314_07380 [Ignavibacteria bacterium]|jgi:hypothetical protein|nr:hypothetical protein [Ignavibacteria bacterium]MCU7502877.1 hypothetical protein [Ignavibacteria bacterium]MCU7515629.1 hypothetical protein [Ignavibacteria bacterium]
MLYLISDDYNPQTELLKKIARKNGIKCRNLCPKDPQFTVSISPEEILLCGSRPEKGSVFFLSGVYYRFPFGPALKPSADWTFFQDFHLSQQQQTSQLYSLLYILSSKKNEYTVINDFSLSLNLTSRHEVLMRLKDAGLSVPELCLTNSLSEARLMFNRLGGILWSSPDSMTPVREIGSEKLEELFNAGSLALPHLMYEPKRGSLLRLTFFEDNPLLISLISPPERGAFKEELEKFTHYIPQPVLKNMGKTLFRLLGMSFYEAFGVLDDSGNFWFYDVSFDPNISYMDQAAQTYTLSCLLEGMLKKSGLEKKIPRKPVIQGKRKTIFLKRMLVHLFEIQQNQELR